TNTLRRVASYAGPSRAASAASAPSQARDDLLAEARGVLAVGGAARRREPHRHPGDADRLELQGLLAEGVGVGEAAAHAGADGDEAPVDRVAAPALVGERAQLADPGGEVVERLDRRGVRAPAEGGRHRERAPALRVLGDAPPRAPRVAADPDRRVRL